MSKRNLILVGLLIATTTILLSVGGAVGEETDFLSIAKQTGITITKDDGATVWTGEYDGVKKPNGPLVGKKIALLIAAEFDDWQAYYLASYIGEFGGDCEFLTVPWVEWKDVRPSISAKKVTGEYGLTVPIVPAGGAKHTAKDFREADPADYDALVVLGGNSADVMITEDSIMEFIRTVDKNGGIVGAIGGGSLPLIRAGVVDGKRATGNTVVDYLIDAVGVYTGAPVEKDGNLITARDTVNTPAFLREICKAFDPTFRAPRKDILKGTRVALITGDDYEDIELVVPLMELIYRGARVTIATFPPPIRSRPALPAAEGFFGSVGTSIPPQEIPEGKYFKIQELKNMTPDDLDVVLIPGAFNPWNMVEEVYPTEFVKEAYEAGKIIAPICHGPIVLAAADLVKGKVITAWAASEVHIKVMGGKWTQHAAVVDGRIVTAKTPPQIPEFLDAITLAVLG